MRLVNTFEGGTDLVGITAANSATGGDPFDATSTATGAVRCFAAAQVMYGQFSMQNFTAATSGASRGSWRPGTFTRMYGRCFFRASSTAVLRNLFALRDNAGGSTLARISISTAAKLIIQDPTPTTVATSTTTIATDTWYRVEWSLGTGTSVNATARLYQGDSTALLEQLSVTANFGTVSADDVSWGVVANAANAPEVFFDCIEARDDGYPGPWIRANGALGCG